jgi:hypothetical protein
VVGINAVVAVCHNGMARPQVADGGDGLHPTIRKVFVFRQFHLFSMEEMALTHSLWGRI